MRTRLKRQARRRQDYIHICGVRFRKGQRGVFRATGPDGRVWFSGWFIADSTNPVCRLGYWRG